jgi:hypothetical protein
MLLIIVAGLVLLALAFVFLGPAPFLRPLLGALFGPWLIWVSLSVAGMGAGMAFVPLLPAILDHLWQVRLLLSHEAKDLLGVGEKINNPLSEADLVTMLARVRRWGLMMRASLTWWLAC